MLNNLQLVDGNLIADINDSEINQHITSVFIQEGELFMNTEPGCGDTEVKDIYIDNGNLVIDY